MNTDAHTPNFAPPHETPQQESQPHEPGRRDTISLQHVEGGPSPAFIGMSWLALAIGALGFLIGLYNAEMQLNEKGYYLTLLMYGLFAAVAVQKSVRDKLEDIPVSSLFLGLSWASAISALTLLCIGLWNANLSLSEKGFYGIAYTMSLFAAVAVQKNVRDAMGAQNKTTD